MGRPLRIALCGAVCALLASGGPGAAAAQRALPADALVDSVGVNIHSVYYDTAYGDWAGVVRALRTIGLRHVRDGLGVSPNADYNRREYGRLNALTPHGIRATLIMGRPGWDGGSIDMLLRAVREEVPNVVEALEGPNELDLFGDSAWATQLRAYQAELYAKAKRTPGLSGVPVIGPSFGRAQNRNAFGDVSAFADVANIHPYPGGRKPAGAHFDQELADVAATSGGKPVVATETGYHNALAAHGDQAPVSEAAAQAYVGTLPLHYLSSGVTRTFFYELFDEQPEAGLADQEQHFGLLRSDGSMKPAAVTLQNLLGLLADPGAPFETGALEYALAAPPGVRQMLFQKRDGTFFVVLWQDATVYDIDHRVDTPVPDQPATLTLGQPMDRARVFRPAAGATALKDVAAPAAVEVAVPADPIVVALTPPAPPPAATSQGTPAQPPRPVKRGMTPLVIGRHGARLTGGGASIRMRCAVRLCTGKVDLFVRLGRRWRVLGRANLHLAGGKTVMVLVRTRLPVRRTVRGRRVVQTRVRVALDGWPASVTQTVPVRRGQR